MNIFGWNDLVTGLGALAALATIIGVISSIVFYRKGQKRKEIKLELISAEPLINIDSENRNKVQVTYDGQNTSDLFRVVLRLRNTGHSAISSTAYDRGGGIIFDFGSNVTVLEAEILPPVSQKPDMERASSKVTLKPFSLNSQESIKLKILLSQAVSKVSIDTHILDVKTPTHLSLAFSRRFSTVSRREIMLGTTGLVGWLAAIGSIVWFRPNQKSPPSPLLKMKSSPTPAQISSPRPNQPIFSYEITHIYRHHTGGVFSVAWSPSGKYVASTGLDKTVQAWFPNGKSDTPSFMQNLFGVGESLTWSPDDRYIATADDTGFVHIWDWQANKSIFDAPQKYNGPKNLVHPQLSC